MTEMVFQHFVEFLLCYRPCEGAASVKCDSPHSLFDVMLLDVSLILTKYLT